MIDQSRVNEIAFIAMKKMISEKGIELRPLTTKLDILELSHNLGISEVEAADVSKMMSEEIFREHIEKIDEVITAGEVQFGKNDERYHRHDDRHERMH